MPYYKKIVGAKCYLSPCDPADAEKWAEWETDLEVTLPLGDEAYTPTSPEKARQQIESILERQSHVFTIVDLESDRCIGRCMLFNVNHVDRHAMLGIVIGEKECWDQGYGQEATRLLLDYGFNLLNLHNIMLGTFSFNERALQCYRRVGFREIGRRRQARIVAGKAYDLILMDMLVAEFASPYVKGLLEADTADDWP